MPFKVSSKFVEGDAVKRAKGNETANQLRLILKGSEEHNSLESSGPSAIEWYDASHVHSKQIDFTLDFSNRADFILESNSRYYTKIITYPKDYSFKSREIEVNYIYTSTVGSAIYAFYQSTFEELTRIPIIVDEQYTISLSDVNN